MKVAIISDTHENYHNLRLALNEAKSRGAECIINLGDTGNPGLCRELFEFCKNNKVRLISIFGNVDGNKGKIVKLAMENGIEQQATEFHIFELEDRIEEYL